MLSHSSSSAVRNRRRDSGGFWPYRTRLHSSSCRCSVEDNSGDNESHRRTRLWRGSKKIWATWHRVLLCVYVWLMPCIRMLIIKCHLCNELQLRFLLQSLNAPVLLVVIYQLEFDFFFLIWGRSNPWICPLIM